ncbi:hypothetical protein [uncultured Bilophila sp.]|uniref:hypothetical protein n=1 Tax=uncultured Bilophila sp. TaxID=529385 RepID=UPI00261196D3|nr:hypothetical protein [uncultured Bilophila sp.]
MSQKSKAYPERKKEARWPRPALLELSMMKMLFETGYTPSLMPFSSAATFFFLPARYLDP